MKKQKLYSYIRQALDKYSMLEENDKIAIGVSGGKDSLALLYGLAGLRKFYPIKFNIVAITVDLGYDLFETEQVNQLCKDLDVEYYVVKTQISDILRKYNSHKSQCSLCSKLRKGALNDFARGLGCNKIAYAHNNDDIIETMLMSLFFEGRFYTFPPVTYMEDSNISIIRPLMYISEAEVIGFRNKYNLNIIKNPCPYDGRTKRQYVKEIVSSLNKDNPGIKNKLFHSIECGNIDDWTKL